jgi:hypothetical protein
MSQSELNLHIVIYSYIFYVTYLTFYQNMKEDARKVHLGTFTITHTKQKLV